MRKKMIYNSSDETVVANYKDNNIIFEPKQKRKMFGLSEKDKKKIARSNKHLIFMNKKPKARETRDIKKVIDSQDIFEVEKICVPEVEKVCVPHIDNTNSLPNVSIIIPAFKSEKYIKECIDSILKQTHFENTENSFEILVGVDNCRKTLKKTLELYKDNDNVRIFWMKENKGCYVIRNTLIPEARYDNLIIFDSDDIMKPEMIARLADVLVFSPKSEVIRYKYENFGDEESPSSFKQKVISFFTFGTIFLKRSIYDKNISFMDWICGADNEFVSRIEKDKIFNFDEVLMNRRKHPTSLTCSTLTGGKCKLRQTIAFFVNNITKKGLNKYVMNVKNEFVEINETTKIQYIREKKHKDMEIAVMEEIKKIKDLTKELCDESN